MLADDLRPASQRGKLGIERLDAERVAVLLPLPADRLEAAVVRSGDMQRWLIEGAA